jgi:hypothetical protein
MARLPKGQRETLITLGDKQAVDRERALSVFDGIPQNSVGALIRHGLATKAVKRRHGAQRTCYWPGGLDEYRQEKERSA